MAPCQKQKEEKTMNVLKPLSFDEAQSETQEIFTALKVK